LQTSVVFYSLHKDALSSSTGRMTVVMKWEVYERKRSWPILKNTPVFAWILLFLSSFKDFLSVA